MIIGSRDFLVLVVIAVEILREEIQILKAFLIQDIFREFDDMHREMARMYNTFNDISTNPPPKELVREYQTPEGEKVREVGPIVYGYSMTIGPDGKPHVREFGNVKSLGSSAIRKGETSNKPQDIDRERAFSRCTFNR